MRSTLPRTQSRVYLERLGGRGNLSSQRLLSISLAANVCSGKSEMAEASRQCPQEQRRRGGGALWRVEESSRKQPRSGTTASSSPQQEERPVAGLRAAGCCREASPERPPTLLRDLTSLPTSVYTMEEG